MQRSKVKMNKFTLKMYLEVLFVLQKIGENFGYQSSYSLLCSTFGI